MSNTVVCFLVEYAKVTLGLRKALHHENNNFTFVVFFPSPLLLHLLLSSVLLFFLCRIVSLSVPFFNLPPSLCLWWQTSLISCMRRPCQSWRRTWRAVRRMMMMMSPQNCDSLTSCQRSSPTSETPQRHPHSSPERQVTLPSCQRSSPTSETPQPWPHSPNLLTRGRVKFEAPVTELTFIYSGLFQRSSDIFRNVNISFVIFFYISCIFMHCNSSIVNEGVLNPVSVDHFVLCGFSSGHQWRKTSGLFTRVLLHQCHHRLALCHQTGQPVSVTIGPVI